MVALPAAPRHGRTSGSVRRCRTKKVLLSGKPAIVLDIDETSLSNYADLAAHGFDASALALSAVNQRLVRDGIRFFKLFLVIGREMQLKRFHERRHDPFKKWKITDIDLAAIKKWDDYSEAQREMFRFTNTTIWSINQAR